MENCGARGAAAFFMSASPTLSHDAPVHQPPDRLPWQEQQSPRLYSVGRPLPKNTIRFKCVDCGRPMEARAQDGGVDTNCPHCAAPLTVPRIPPNPYLRPIKNIVRQIPSKPLKCRTCDNPAPGMSRVRSAGSSSPAQRCLKRMPKPDQMVRIQGNDVGDGEKKSDREKSAETTRTPD